MEDNAQKVIMAIRNALQKASKTPEQNKALCNKYPFLIWYGDPLYKGYSEDHELSYRTTWEDELISSGPGWAKAFCPQIWDELKAILEKANYVNDFRFTQIKEKYGELRLYFGGVPEKIYDEVEAWANKYLELSKITCVDCGKKPTYMSTGWINYRCTDCTRNYIANQDAKWGSHDLQVKIQDIDKFYENREAYFEEHKDDKI